MKQNKTIKSLTKEGYTFAPNLVILAWLVEKLSSPVIYALRNTIDKLSFPMWVVWSVFLKFNVWLSPRLCSM